MTYQENYKGTSKTKKGRGVEYFNDRKLDFESKAIDSNLKPSLHVKTSFYASIDRLTL